MSKIEKALKKAGEKNTEKDKTLGQKTNRRGHNRRADEASENLPVVARLRPGEHHDIDPQVLKQNHLICDGIADDVLTQYKILRTKILQQFGAKEFTSLGITSPRKNTGVTTTAINLAIALSSHGALDVTLVDFNLRDPSIADYLGLPEDKPGLKAYIDSTVAASDIFWDVGIDNLNVLANRDLIKDSSEQLMSEKVRDLVKAFGSQRRNPIVIYDLPPVLTTDDAVAISPIIDAFLLVVSEGETERSDINDVVEALGRSNVLGVLLNKSARRRAIS